MNFSESDIQSYIWGHKEDLFSMIEVPTFEAEPQKMPGEFEPWELLYYQTLKEYKKSYDSLQGLELFGCEVRLAKEGDSTIRTDLMGCLEGENGLVICELKVNRQPERQAYTELHAYANHVRSKFPPMGRRDIFYLLISPMEECIVREATINNLLYDKNRVVALIPQVEDSIETLKFTLWIPSKEEFSVFAKTAFAFENIDVFKISWRGAEGVWSPTEEGKEPNDEMIHRLNKVSHYAAQLMEANGINGFVYCSQLYPKGRDLGFLENGITICGVNPFKSAKTRYLYGLGCSLHEAASTEMEVFELGDVIPSLKGKGKDAIGQDYVYWLSENWSTCIDEIALRVEKMVNYTFEPEHHEHSWGTYTWESLLNNSSEDMYCWNYDINLTGIFREIYELKLARYYEGAKEFDVYTKDEILDDGVVEWHLIDMLYSHDHIREFIKGLTGEDLITEKM